MNGSGGAPRHALWRAAGVKLPLWVPWVLPSGIGGALRRSALGDNIARLVGDGET